MGIYLSNFNFIFCGHVDEKKVLGTPKGGGSVSRQSSGVGGGGWAGCHSGKISNRHVEKKVCGCVGADTFKIS